MASQVKSPSVQHERTQRLRAAMGVAGDWHLQEASGFQIAIQTQPDLKRSQLVVCLHATGSGSREFRPLLERSLTGARLALLDWPGHGRSEDLEPDRNPISLDRCSQILAAVLDQIAPPGARNPILVGSGFGAAVAIHYAAIHPNRISALALCQPAGLIPPAPSDSAARNILSRAWLALSGKRSRSQKLSPADRQALRLRALKPCLQTAIDQAEASLRNSSADLTAKLGALHCPVLFALSKDSCEYPLERYLSLLDPLLARAPQHRFTIFTGSFHPIWDEPDRFAQALTGFVQAQLPLRDHRHAWILTAVDLADSRHQSLEVRASRLPRGADATLRPERQPRLTPATGIFWSPQLRIPIEAIIRPACPPDARCE